MLRGALFLAIVLCTACAASYSNNLQLNPNYSIYWNVVSDTIQLKLEVNTTGWVRKC
jgi:hypothetical protein